jgi:hypothetical protein
MNLTRIEEREMDDDNFAEYQKLRQQAENEIRGHIFQWAMRDAPSEMTLSDVRGLADQLVIMMNVATRRAYEVGSRVSA